MPRKITFIHAADIHLGAPVRGFCNLSPEWEEVLLEAIPEAYDRVIAAALAREVDFVVIAGDMFDTSNASFGDYLRFFEGLARLDEAGIPSYLVTGNHDPYSTWSASLDRLPASAHLLGGETPGYALYERDGEPLCLIGARGYRNQSWPQDEQIAHGITRDGVVSALSLTHPNASRAPLCIGIVHTALSPDQSKAYSNPEALMAADVDYWACGHLHERFALPSDDAPRIVFPGCIQGRDIKESGTCGCYFVEMTEGSEGCGPHVSIEYIPTSSVVFHAMHVDVSPCKTLPDAISLVQNALFHENGRDHCERMVVRITLEGETGLHEYLRQPDVLASIRKRLNDAYPTFFCDALVDRTAPKRDRAVVKSEGLFPANVLRVSDLQQRRGDEMVNYLQSEFVKRGVAMPSSLELRIGDFGKAAETLVMDLLEENE